MIDDLAEKANAALKEMESFDQEKVDHIVHEMAMAALDQHMPLAKMAVEKQAAVFTKIKQSKICMRPNIFGIISNMIKQLV